MANELTSFIKLLESLEEGASIRCVKLSVVGGTIRDIFLQEANSSDNAKNFSLLPLDLDLIIDKDLEHFTKYVETKYNLRFSYNNIFHTAKLISSTSTCIDIAQMRAESYPSPGELPLTKEGSYNENIDRRDFTINTLSVSLRDYIEYLKQSSSEPNSKNSIASLKTKLLDRHNGLLDIYNKKIRVLHAKSFIDDPTRLFRAVRYAFKINKKIKEGFDHFTLELFYQALEAKTLNTISYNRKLAEIKRCFEGLDKQEIKALIKEEIVIELISYSFDVEQKDISSIEGWFESFARFKEMVFLYSKCTDEKLISALEFNKKKIAELKFGRQKLL